MAIFREWFAARAIVDRSVSIDEIDLNSDRWVIPLAIAINSENPDAGPEIMKKLSSTDPGMAGLVLDEVNDNWSVVKPAVQPTLGTTTEAGARIITAIENWKTGLQPLMSALAVLDQNGNIPTLGIEVEPGKLTTSWYQGDETLPSVVLLPKGIPDLSTGLFWNWRRWCSRDVEFTRVWPWTVTHHDLSYLLSEELRSLKFAQATKVGLWEFFHEFTGCLRRNPNYAEKLNTAAEVIDHLENQLSEPGGGSNRSVTFGHKDYSWTPTQFEQFKDKVLLLAGEGIDPVTDPWVGPDKEWPPGKTGGLWFERYTDEQLLQRTNGIFNGALQIYNEIVDQWLQAFKKRNQLTYALPFRLRGELRLTVTRVQSAFGEPILTYWQELANDANDSGVFIELGPNQQNVGKETQQKILLAREKFF